MYSVCCWSSVLRILPVSIGSDDGGFISTLTHSLAPPLAQTAPSFRSLSTRDRNAPALYGAEDLGLVLQLETPVLYLPPRLTEKNMLRGLPNVESGRKSETVKRMLRGPATASDPLCPTEPQTTELSFVCCTPYPGCNSELFTMFRKKQDVAERSRSLLKNSAAKKIKTEILAALPTLSKDVIDELMPNKASSTQRQSHICSCTYACCRHPAHACLAVSSRVGQVLV